MAPEKSIAESEVLCEYCKKSFEPNKILKHIGHVKACKSFYGPRYDELKKEQQRKKVEKFRSKLSNEQKLEIDKRKRELYAKNSEYREKQIRENAKRREKKVLEQLEKNKKLQQDKVTGNENSEEKTDFVEDETGEKWQCEFCKTFWIPTSILMHIGNNENCKSHYGPRYGDLKKKHKRVYQELYREDVGTEKELEQQRKRYASDPKVKERKKKYYDKNHKKPKEMEKRKKNLEEGARRAKESVIHHEKSLRFENTSFQWIIDCFRHLFETFSDIDNQTKDKLLDLEKNISKKYDSNESEIDEMTKSAKENLDQHDSLPFPNHFECGLYFKKDDRYLEAIFQEEWGAMKKSTMERFQDILCQVEEPLKQTDWYKSLGKINNMYLKYGKRKQGFDTPIMDTHFLEQKVCIICKDRAHRISFDKNFAAKFPKLYSYYT